VPTVTSGEAACGRVYGFVSLILAVGLATLPLGAAAATEDDLSLTLDEPLSIEIPRVMERPLSVDDGPEIEVSRFELNVDPKLAAVISPELIAQVDATLETRRVAQGRFTIGRLEEVATEITTLLRENDFIVAYAYVPTQEVENGIVNIGVLGGSLGKVHVEGNQALSERRIASHFDRLMGQPLQGNRLESAMLNLRDVPGVAPSAVLSPGAEVGTTDLTLRVLERRFNIQAMVDNYGSEATGEGRGRLRFDWNNPFGAGDRLTLNILQTFSPADGTFGGVNYEIPIGNRGTSVGALVDYNTFDATARGTDFKTSGESQTIAAYVRQKLKRGRRFNMDLSLDLASKKATFEPIFALDQEDALTVMTAALDLEAVDRIGPLGVNSLYFGWSHGFADFLGSMDEEGVGDNGKISTRVGSTGIRAGGEFDKIVGRYQRLQRLNNTNSIILRAFGQWTDDLLTPLEQLSLGGPYTVRAYPTAQALVDKGWFGSAEYTLNLTGLVGNTPQNWDLNFSLFYDYASGDIIDAFQSEDDSVKLGGYGGGLHFEYRWPGGHGVMVRAEVATPSTSDEADNERDPQYWLRFEYFRR
jgi:hemolysin activation/secretion protein